MSAPDEAVKVKIKQSQRSHHKSKCPEPILRERQLAEDKFEHELAKVGTEATSGKEDVFQVKVELDHGQKTNFQVRVELDQRQKAKSEQKR